MKKTIFLLAIIFIASFSFLNAQNAVYQTTDLSAIYSEHHLPFPDQERADCEMTYLGTDPSTQVGFPLWSNWYPTACISYTASQVEPYVGGKLTKIILAVPASEFFPSMYFNPSASKVYVKHSLSGAVVYEQTFNPVFDSWNTIVLNTPQTVSAGSGFVIGVQYSFSAACDPPPSPCETYIRPFKATTAAEDPAVPGGFYYICSNNASNYGAGATFQPITNYGNFGIKGYVVDCDFPENDMAALGVSFQEPSQWKEMKEYYTYSVGVKNIGTNPQNNFKVQLTDNNGNVLAEETITEQLAWGATKVVEFPYAHPIEGYLTLRGKVILSGDEVAINDISDPVTLLIYTPDLLKYIETQGHNGGFYIGGEISNAVGFPAAGLSPYAGKQLVGMAIDFWDARGFENYIHLWVRNSLDGDDLWFSFEFPKSGWNYIKIDPPIDLENKDIYFGWTGATTEDFISITHANGVPNPNGYWYKPVGGDWKQGVNSPDDQYNLCIVGLVKPVGTDPVTNLKVEYDNNCDAHLTWSSSVENATFNVYRNFQPIATKITDLFYTDAAFDVTLTNKWSVTTVLNEIESDHVTVEGPPCLGINPLTKTAFSIFPNPSQSKITITAESNINGLEIYNFLGQTVVSQFNIAHFETTLDVSILNNGVYFIRITTENGSLVKKFLKQ